MVTKVFVSQIDRINPNGSSAADGSYIVLTATGPEWQAGSTPIGYQGSIGAVGFRGSTGFAGSVGTAGAGYVGSIGSVGFQGSAGLGFQGSAGAIGFRGSVGEPGTVGDLGTKGFQGSAGFQGSVGAGGPGYTGSIGGVGFQGSAGGGTGYVGSIGFQGCVGFQGSAGGGTGFQGSIGFQGSLGFQGSAGTATFTTLTDGPGVFTGKANNFVRVNQAATALIYDSNVYLTNVVTSNVSFITGFGTSGPDILLCNTIIYGATLRGYSEKIVRVGASGASKALGSTSHNFNIQTIILTSGVVAITLPTIAMLSSKLNGFGTAVDRDWQNKQFSIVLYLMQDASGSRTVDWSPNTIYWPETEGTPVLSTNPGWTDVVTLVTLNGGSSWFGTLSAKGFSTTYSGTF